MLDVEGKLCCDLAKLKSLNLSTEGTPCRLKYTVLSRVGLDRTWGNYSKNGDWLDRAWGNYSTNGEGTNEQEQGA